MKIRLTCAVFILILYSCKEKQEKVKPVTENITESVYAAGTIKTKKSIPGFSTVSGIIDKIFVTENDLVKAGSPLLLISDETSKLNRENAGLAADFADMSANNEKLTDLKNSIALAQSKLKNDSLVFIRQQNLWNQDIGSKTELELKELAYKNSRTALESVKIKYNDLLRQLKYNAQQSRNNLAISKFRESDFTIKSEIDGKVYSILKKRGEMVNSQTALAIVGDANAFLIELQIDEYDIVKVELGQHVLVSMDSYKGKTFEARISRVNPLMNERTKSFTVEAEFVKPPAALYPNLTVEANIVIHAKKNALTIPRSYLIDDSIVMIAKDKKKIVKTGLKDYQKVEIIDGLTANDVIYKP